MLMREFVDRQLGDGAWDDMHDHIDQMHLFGWKMPAIPVDGREVHIFPGSNREVTLEQVQDEIRKVFRSMEH